MKRSVTVAIIVGVALILIGAIIFGSVMLLYKWDFAKLSTEKYETNNYNITEGFKNITVVTTAADIEFVPSETDAVSVTCYEQVKVKHSVAVKEDALIIKADDTRKWYNYIGIHFKSPKIVVCVPQGEYGALSVKSDTSNVVIPNDFTFESVDISGSTGNVVNRASVSGEVRIKLTTGNIVAENISVGALDLSVTTGAVTLSDVTCDGDIKVKVTTGKADLNNISCKNITSKGDTGDISFENVTATDNISVERSTGNVKLTNTVAKGSLTVNTDTGDVKLDSSDGGSVKIETDTGSVKGSLLTDKIFFAESDTGSIKVPKTDKGGRCEITTDTGDIKISIK